MILRHKFWQHSHTIHLTCDVALSRGAQFLVVTYFLDDTSICTDMNIYERGIVEIVADLEKVGSRM